MGIDSPRQDMTSARIDHLRTRRRVEARPDGRDHSIVDENIGPPRTVVIDDRAAANKHRHCRLSLLREVIGFDPKAFFVQVDTHFAVIARLDRAIQ
jgi:hypothetical protein